MAKAEEKKAILLQLLAAGKMTVHLDARKPGVRVPPQHRQDGHLQLNLSYRYDGIQLLVDWYRIAATLSFDKTSYRCILPWDAVFGLTSETRDGEVWVEDMPPDVVEAMSKKAEPKKPRHLKLVS